MKVMIGQVQGDLRSGPHDAEAQEEQAAAEVGVRAAVAIRADDIERAIQIREERRARLAAD